MYSAETVLMLIQTMRPKLSKDGNVFCFLYGETLQEGIAGFGETPMKAAFDFCHSFMTETIQGAENAD
jgi:hypothetical protein